MKKKQIARRSIQIVGIILTLTGLLINASATMMIIAVTTLLGGAFFCGWFCPFGTLQEWVGHLGDRLGIKKLQMPKPLQKYLKATRYIILVIFTLWASDTAFMIMGLDPRNAFNAFLSSGTMEGLMLLVMASFVGISLFFRRPFCNYFCMEGAKKGIMGGLRPFTIKRDTNRCVNCKKCDRVCPMNIEVSKKDQMRSLQCINCFECVDACPVADTLTYGMVKYNKREIRKMGMVVLVALLVLVLPNYAATHLAQDSGQVVGNQSQVVSIETTPAASEDQATNTASNEASQPVNDSIYNDGVYTGQGNGFKSVITVEVTIEGGKIISVMVTDQHDDARWFNRANDTIPSSVVAAQSGNVDTVSGATYSSRGIIEATNDALSKARK